MFKFCVYLYQELRPLLKALRETIPLERRKSASSALTKCVQRATTLLPPPKLPFTFFGVVKWSFVLYVCSSECYLNTQVLDHQTLQTPLPPLLPSSLPLSYFYITLLCSVNLVTNGYDSHDNGERVQSEDSTVYAFSIVINSIYGTSSTVQAYLFLRPETIITRHRIQPAGPAARRHCRAVLVVCVVWQRTRHVGH